MKKEIFEKYKTAEFGLTNEEVKHRLEQYGKNSLPEEKPANIIKIFIKQFFSPLIYILLFAGAMSFLIGEYVDSYFIFGVLIFNATIGTIQEYSAGKSASSLKSLVQVKTFVIRNGKEKEINAVELVPGDIVVIKPGMKVPADIVLIEDKSISADESMLTGESVPVTKSSEYRSTDDYSIQERRDVIFAGTIITRGNGIGIVSKTGLHTEIGKVAESIAKQKKVKPPLLLRMEKFSYMMAIIMMVAIVAIAFFAFHSGISLHETFLLSVGLAVAAIPEGLPIAITITLAVGMARMAKRNVIIRNLVAVESLGSCTTIASDKTGTLTLNELTITELVCDFKNVRLCRMPEIKKIKPLVDEKKFDKMDIVKKIVIASVLSNESVKTEGSFYGDPVDIAFLKLAEKMGYSIDEIRGNYKKLDVIHYASEIKYSAAFYKINGDTYVFVKGSPETLIEMSDGSDAKAIKAQVDSMSKRGLKVLGIAYGKIRDHKGKYTEKNLKELKFLSLAGMIDPLRPEAESAIRKCKEAGIEVRMITGDNPLTAFVIAKNLNLISSPDKIVIGTEIKVAKNEGEHELDELTEGINVFARIEPNQKLDIVDSMGRQGHFVAVTGDGVNDAPALKHAHVGVAMGKSGTDIARESSDIIITDDNFASIVNGIEEGRIAYSNIRKLIFLLISAGIAEIAIFIVAFMFGLPIPFFAAQLLWLNIVTEGIQDVALSFEKGEGYEMKEKPRSPNERIFNKIMIKRVVLSVIVMTVGVVATYYYLVNFLNWETDDARNTIIMLMVLFENMQVFNSRSENCSLFKQKFKNNPYIVIGALGAMLVHIGATYTPWLSNALKIHPIGLEEWFFVLIVSLSLIVIMEFEKLFRRDKRCKQVPEEIKVVEKEKNVLELGKANNEI